MKNLIILFVLFYSFVCIAQEEVSIRSNDVMLFGTLLEPAEKSNKAILFISGSGNTNRDGNTLPGYKNDALKLLAESLTQSGYVTLRYDKRGVAKSASDSLKQEDVRFEHFVKDASNWLGYLNDRYDEVTVIGHSQGGLIGMMAIQNAGADRFVSLAGMASDLYTTLLRQMSNQPPFVIEAARPIFDSLRVGVKTDSVPQFLYSVAHPKLQDYIMSFMRYDPKKEVQKLNVPVLVVQGTTDLQVTVEEATEMAALNPKSSLVIVEGMNHVLREAPAEMNANLSTYSKPQNPLHPDLVAPIEDFLAE